MAGVRLGIGDDAAVLERGAFDLVALDTMVEGVHFRWGWSSAADVGWKLLARNLSDIAAMGGTSGPFLLSFALGEGVDGACVDGLVEGLEAAARAMVEARGEVGPIGGDTTRSPGPTVLSLTLFGRTGPRGPVTRRGAQAGDVVAVVGALGAAAAGLEVLQRGLEGVGRWAELVEAHRRPWAQVRAGAWLGRQEGVRAMIDVSDGFAQDLGHLLRPAGLGARVEFEALPSPAALRACAVELGAEGSRWVLAGGDDYALVVIAAAGRFEAIAAAAAGEGIELVSVGRVRSERGVEVVGAGGLQIAASLAGYEHTFEGGGEEG